MRLINIDLDGVLANFKQGYFNATGHKFDPKEDPRVRWNRLLGKELGFYSSLPAFEGARAFAWEIRLMQSKDTYMRILSAMPSVVPFSSAYYGKMNWVQAEIGGNQSVCICECSEAKQYYARPGDILIDDNPLNIEQWISRGGVGILHTSFEDSIKQLRSVL